MISQYPDTQSTLDLLREMEDIGKTSEHDWNEVDVDTNTIQLVHTAQTVPYTNNHYQLEVSQMDHDSYMNAEYMKLSDDNNAEKQPTQLRKDRDTQKSSNHGARKQTTQLVDAQSQKKSSKRKEEEPKEQTFCILCKSPPQSLRRQSPELSPLNSRGTSGGNDRRASLVKSIHIVEQEEEDDRKEDFHKDNMSLTEKRMAMTRDRFSAKNLFNVKRQNTGSYFTDAYTGKSDHSSDGLRKAMSAMTMSQQQSFSQGQRRPKTSVSTFQGRRVHSIGSARGNLRPTLSASRQVEYGDPHFSTGADIFGRSRHPRSRRELEKLSRMKVDPLRQDDVEEEVPAPVESWIPRDVHHDLLERLRRRGPLLQRRVTSFLEDLDDFNRRRHKSGLEHILEIT